MEETIWSFFSFKTIPQCFLSLGFLLLQDSPTPISEETLLRDHSTTAWESNFICAELVPWVMPKSSFEFFLSLFYPVFCSILVLLLPQLTW